MLSLGKADSWRGLTPKGGYPDPRSLELPPIWTHSGCRAGQDPQDEGGGREGSTASVYLEHLCLARLWVGVLLTTLLAVVLALPLGPHLRGSPWELPAALPAVCCGHHGTLRGQPGPIHPHTPWQPPSSSPRQAYVSIELSVSGTSAQTTLSPLGKCMGSGDMCAGTWGHM